MTNTISLAGKKNRADCHTLGMLKEATLFGIFTLDDTTPTSPKPRNLELGDFNKLEKINVLTLTSLYIHLNVIVMLLMLKRRKRFMTSKNKYVGINKL